MARHSKSKLFSAHSRGAMNARLRRICIAAAIVVVSIVVLLIVGYSQLLSYLQGDDFRRRMTDFARQSTGAAEAQLESNLSINGSRVSVDGASLSNCGHIREAKASRINAEINRTALFSKHLHIHKLSTEELSLTYVTASPAATPTGKSAKTGRKKKQKATARPTPKPAEKPAETAELKDIDWQIDLFECRDADLVYKYNNKSYQLLGANVTALPAPRIAKKAWQLTAENARLRTPFDFLRESSVKTATLVYQGDTADLTECRIMLTPGDMRVKAHYDLRTQRWSADMQTNKADVHRILNEDWKKRVTGELYGKLTLTGKGSQIITGTGAFSMQNGILEGLPFLSQLPVGNTYPYRSIELEKADCQVIFPYDSDKIKKAWLLDKVNLRSRDGSFLVTGHVLIGSDRRLGGTLQIGVPKSLVSALPLAPEGLTAKLFTAEGNDDAYLWVNMNLSGTIDEPQEDLSIRVATLTGNHLGQMLKQIPRGNAASLLDLLLQQNPKQTPGGETQDSTPAPTTKPADLINDAADAAGSLFQSIF